MSEKKVIYYIDDDEDAIYTLKDLKEIFLMIRRPPRSTRKESSAASDVYKRQVL